MSSLFLKSSSDAVLNSVAMSLRHLASPGHSRTSDAQLAVQKIVDSLKGKVKDVAKLALDTAAVVTPAKKGTKGAKKSSVTRDSEYR